MSLNILRKHFNDTEIRTLQEQPDYEEVMRQIEYAQTNNMLDDLEGRIQERIAQVTDLGERWEIFKLSLRAESTDTESPEDETTTQEGDETSPETPGEEDEASLRETATNTVNERLTTGLRELGTNSRISIFGINIGEFIADSLAEEVINQRNNTEANAWDRLKGSIWIRVLTVLASIFIGKGAREIVDGFNSSMDRIASGDYSLPEISLPDVTLPVEQEEDGTDTIPEQMRLPEVARYNAGLDLIFYFGNIRLPDNQRALQARAYEKMRDITFTELADITTQEDKVGVFGDVYTQNETYKNMVDNILNSGQSRDTRDVIRLSLTHPALTRLLRKSNIRDYIGNERSDEILSNIESGSFSYEDLTFREISYLYTSTFPLSAFRVGANLDLPIDFSDNDFEGVLPLSVTQMIFEIYPDRTAGGREVLSNPQFVSELNDIAQGRLSSPEELQNFRSLISFKDYILSDDFQGNAFVDFTPEERQAFDASLHWRHIIMMYNMMGGARLGEDLGAGSVGLLLTVPRILRTYNGDIADRYNSRTHRRIAESAFRQSLSPEEERAFELYMVPFLRDRVEEFLMTYTAGYRYVRDFAGLHDIHGIAIGAGTLYAGGRLANSAFYGRYLPALRFASGFTIGGFGLTILLSAIGPNIYRYFNEDGTRTDEPLPPELEIENYPGSVMDRELAEASDIWDQMTILNRIEDSTHSFDIDGEPLTVVSYPGQAPFVTYQGRVWGFAHLSNGQISNNILESLAEYFISDNGPVHPDMLWAGDGGDTLQVGENPRSSIPIDYEEIFGKPEVRFESIELRDIGAQIERLFPGSSFNGNTLEVLRVYGGAGTQFPSGNIVLVPYGLTSSENSSS